MRRSWSKDVLCTHHEQDGGECSSCSTVDCATAWPCLRPPVVTTHRVAGATLPRVS